MYGTKEIRVQPPVSAKLSSFHGCVCKAQAVFHLKSKTRDGAFFICVASDAAWAEEKTPAKAMKFSDSLVRIKGHLNSILTPISGNTEIYDFRIFQIFPLQLFIYNVISSKRLPSTSQQPRHLCRKDLRTLSKTWIW